MTVETKKLVKDRYNCEECVLVPIVDIYETEDEYTLKLEMPGITKKDLDVTLDDNELEIRGNVVNNEEEEKNLKYSEYNLYNYYRKFKIGNDINRNSIDATLENGILTLVLKKVEEVKPKRIEITVK